MSNRTFYATKKFSAPKCVYGRTKQFGASTSNVESNKYYVIGDGSGYVGVQSGESLKQMFKGGSLPGNDKFFLNKNGYDTEDEAIEAVKASIYKFMDDED